MTTTATPRPRPTVQGVIARVTGRAAYAHAQAAAARSCGDTGLLDEARTEVRLADAGLRGAERAATRWGLTERLELIGAWRRLLAADARSLMAVALVAVVVPAVLATPTAAAVTAPPTVTVERSLTWSCDAPDGVPADAWRPPIGCEAPFQDAVTPPRPVHDPDTPTTAVRPPRPYAADTLGVLLPLTDSDHVSAPVTRTVSC